MRFVFLKSALHSAYASFGSLMKSTWPAAIAATFERVPAATGLLVVLDVSTLLHLRRAWGENVSDFQSREDRMRASDDDFSNLGALQDYEDTEGSEVKFFDGLHGCASPLTKSLRTARESGILIDGNYSKRNIFDWCLYDVDVTNLSIFNRSI